MTNKKFSKQDYELIQREVPYQGVFRLARYHLRYVTFTGEWSKTFSREILERTSAASILPYDPILDQVVLIEQFRAGALSNPESPWLLEIVAGVCDTNETPENVAKREATEEAGITILDIYPIYEYFVSPGGSNEYLHLFCGRINAATAGGIHGLSEENEDIRAFALPVEEALALLQQGRIKTSPAIISLQWLQLNRERIKKLWLTK